MHIPWELVITGLVTVALGAIQEHYRRRRRAKRVTKLITDRMEK